MTIDGTIAAGGSMSGTWGDNCDGARSGTWATASGAATAIPQTVTVTIDKYIDGQKATDTSANSSSFPMASSWNAANIGPGAGTYSLSPSSYEAQTSQMTSGASYSTNEVTGGSVVGASCSDGKPYALEGYSVGDSLAAAETATKTAGSPALTNITSNKYVIVWNVTCSPYVHVTIAKYVDGAHADATNANSSTFSMWATYNADTQSNGHISGANGYDIGPVGNGTATPYEARTLNFVRGGSYGTNELTNTSVVGASCADGKPFALAGYKVGDTEALAQAASASLVAPSFTDLQSDKFVIVLNTKCPTTGSVSGMKFWDVNGNGIKDTGEPGLSGWTFNLVGPTSGSQVTGAGGTYIFSGVLAGAYTMTETMQTGWTRTTALPAFTLAAGENKTGVNIGNSCFVSTGGLGKGYWTNKNGQATINDGNTSAPELAELTGLNLRTATGGNFDPTTYAQYSTWNSGATATNMAYMLSAQLSALVLAREAGQVNGTKQIVITDPALAGIPGMSPLGVITINDLITAANNELGLHGNTTSLSASRTYQEALKNAVEKAASGASIQLCQVL